MQIGHRGVISGITAVKEEIDRSRHSRILQLDLCRRARLDIAVLARVRIVPVDAVEHFFLAVIFQLNGERIALRRSIDRIGNAAPHIGSEIFVGNVCDNAGLFGRDRIGAGNAAVPPGIVDDGRGIDGLIFIKIELGGENGHLTDAVELHRTVDIAGRLVGASALRLAFKVETNPDLFVIISFHCHKGGRHPAIERYDACLLVFFHLEHGGIVGPVLGILILIAVVLTEPLLVVAFAAARFDVPPKTDLELLHAVLIHRFPDRDRIGGELQFEHVVDRAVFQEDLIMGNGAVKTRPVGRTIVRNDRLALAAAGHLIAAPCLRTPGIVHRSDAVCRPFFGKPHILDVDIPRMNDVAVGDPRFREQADVVGHIENFPVNRGDLEGVRRIGIHRNVKVQIGSQHVHSVFFRNWIDDLHVDIDRAGRKAARFSAHRNVEIGEIGIIPVDLNAEIAPGVVFGIAEFCNDGSPLRIFVHKSFLHGPRIIGHGGDPSLQMHVLSVPVIKVRPVHVFAGFDLFGGIACRKNAEAERCRHERTQCNEQYAFLFHRFPSLKVHDHLIGEFGLMIGVK